MIFPSPNIWKVIAVVLLYIGTYVWFHKAEASQPLATSGMYCDMFQARFDSFAAAMRDGISIERIDKVINETAISDNERDMYHSMITMLVAGDMYKDVLLVARIGAEVKQACVEGVSK